MTTTSLTAPPAAFVEGGRGPAGWTLAGLGAGLAGIVSIGASMAAGAVYDPDIAGDAVAIAEKVGEQTPQILVFHTATMISALLLVVFAAGLRRRLRDRVPSDSLLPDVASSGLLLVSVAGLLGSGLTTEFVFGATDPSKAVPETFAVFSHWIATIPWLWAGAGVAALALARAVFRHGVAARWVGWVSLVLGGFATLFAVSPLQYMAGFFGPLWLTVVSVGLLLSASRTQD